MAHFIYIPFFWKAQHLNRKAYFFQQGTSYDDETKKKPEHGSSGYLEGVKWRVKKGTVLEYLWNKGRFYECLLSTMYSPYKIFTTVMPLFLRHQQ